MRDKDPWSELGIVCVTMGLLEGERVCVCNCDGREIRMPGIHINNNNNKHGNI
jgi:hypothetical protein